jgi:NADH-quinone oxidoreductase subunit L
VLYYAALATAFLTAFYTFRALFMTFHGEKRIPPESGEHIHKPAAAMLAPLALLAGGAAIVGLFFDRTAWGGTNIFADFLGNTPSLAGGEVAATGAEHQFHLAIAALSTLAAVGGIVCAAYLYLGDPQAVTRLKSALDFERLGGIAHYGSPYKLSYGKFFFDELYYGCVVLPLVGVSIVASWFDRLLVDGLVDFVGRVPVAVGSLLRGIQTGLVQFYALAMVLAIIALAVTATLLWSL